MSLSVLGKYEIRGILGRGAAGTVYDAWDPVIARRVAIKTVKLPTSDDPETEEELGRFRREAQAAGRLSHPNIVPVFDYGETDEIAYIVMEYVGGGSLKKLMDQYKQVPPQEVLRVMEQLLSGLQYSHDRGIVHRDIKPANVMLSDDNAVKITDFGIARIEGSGATMVGTMLGTPAYMSPEQWRGDAHIDARSDIYAAGVLLYHMLTGRRPFEGGNQSAIMHQVLNGEFDAPSMVAPAIPRALDGVALKAMAKIPSDRFDSASAFAEALRRAVIEPGDPLADADATLVQPARGPNAAAAQAGRPVPPSPAVALPQQKSKMGLAIGIGLAVVAAGGGAAFLFSGGKQTLPAGEQVAASQPVQTTTPPALAQPLASVSPAVQVPGSGAPAAPEQAAQAPVPSPAAPPAVREVSAAIPCSAVYGEATPARLSLRGVVPSDQAASLYAAFDRTPAQFRSWDVQPLPAIGFYCQIIEAVRPVLRVIGEQAGVTARLLPSPTTHSLQLVENDPIDFDVIGPDAPSVLQVDYIDSTGKVSHYMPRKAAPAFASRHLKPSEHVRLFDIVPGAAFQVGPPAGTDLVVIIASSEPLQMPHVKDDDEPVGAYVSALRSTLEAARRRGVRLSVELVPVESLETPKK